MPSFTLAVLIAVGVSAAIFDLGRRKIPNILTAGAALLGLVLALHSGGFPGLGLGVLGLLTGLALFLPGFLLRMTGGGDVKLMAAFGAYLGPAGTLHAFLIYVLAALAWAAGYGLYAWHFKGASLPFQRYGSMVRTLLRTGQVAYVRPTPREIMGQRAPMAPAIAFGAIAAAWLIPG